ncbi:MAG: MFS transporter [Candidatus Binataceae bacterium]
MFQRRDFKLFLLAMFLASLASAAQSVAVSWQIYAIARTPLALGYAGLAQFLPMAMLALPAGDLADRRNRRTILSAGFMVQALCAGALLALTYADYRVIAPFYIVLAMLGTVRAFVQPASQAFLPLLVPPEQFPEAVAWTSSARQTATIGGPALGGLLYVFGPLAAYGMCFAMFAAVALAFALIHTRSIQWTATPGQSAFARVTAAIKYVRTRPVILGAISLDLFAVLLGGATALLPIYARDILRVGPAGLGLLRSAPALGAAMMGLGLVRVPPRRRAGLMMFGCVAMFGIATIVFGLSRDFALSLGALIILGASDMVSVYVRHTLTQLATPDAMRGRVSALSSLFIGTSNELGEFESGVTAAWFGTVPSVVIGGLGTLGVVALWMWMFPSLRRVDDLAGVTAE